MAVRYSATLTLVTVMSLAGCAWRRPPAYPAAPRDITSLTLVGQHSIPPLQLFPPAIGVSFGGISGITLDRAGALLGISDAQQGGRIYRFAIDGLGSPAFRVAPEALTSLENLPGRTIPDFESMTLLADGSMILCVEGTSREPRVPPALGRYTRDGALIAPLPVPDRYVPEPTGTQTKGARGNAGFESVTVSPDGRRLFVGNESALMQDGEPASFEAGTQIRIGEYHPKGDSFQPRREFVYQLEPVAKPSFTPTFFINGLADLLALNRTTLLALERGFTDPSSGSEASKTARGVNTIRIYRISLNGATDVSKLDSLKGQSGIVPVTKTLLLDLGQVQGLSPDLSPELDNFEGMAFGPRLPDGRATLLLASDDNFSQRQRTWFLLFAIQ